MNEENPFPSEEVAEAFREQLLTWGNENIRDFPWRAPDATFYEVFVAEFFLTQTPVTNVETIFPEFVQRYPDLEAIATAPHRNLVEKIRPLGFQNQRASALKQIAEKVDGNLPRDPDQLRDLPQVGEYVADATVCFALDAALPIVDKNVRRVYRRLFGDNWPQTPGSQRAFAQRLLPPDRAREYNMALLDFGSLICKPKVPECERCFAADYCSYFQDG